MAEADALALQEHRGTRAILRMVEFAPATGGLALWVLHQDLPEDAPGPLLATDGQTLFYRPAFTALPLDEQVGRVAHAVLHVALRHLQRYLELRQLIGDADLQLFNLCADAIVNSTLWHVGWLQVPAGSVTLERLLAESLGLNANADSSLLEWDVERLYREIDDRRPADGARQRSARQRGGQGGQQAGTGRSGGDGGNGQQPRTASGADTQNADDPAGSREDGPRAARARSLGAALATDLQPGPATQGAPEAEADAARAWSERILRAHASDGLFSMLRALIADLPRSRTPWEQVLRTLLARSLSPKLSLSWSRPSRSYIANQGRMGPHHRLPWEPGFSGQRPAPRLVVVVDVSGSIADKLLERFAREIEAITRRLEAALVLVIGDERVQKVTRFEPGRSDLRQIAFNGGGGTDFTPLLEEADRHRPDLIVVLTDLEGPAHYRPRSPVVWAVPEPVDLAVAPFGRKLSLH